MTGRGWQAPTGWWRRAEAFHGRSPRRAVPIDATAAHTVDLLLARVTPDVERSLRHDATPADVRTAGTRFLTSRVAGAAPADPLGAAVIWIAATEFSDTAMQVAFLDDLVGKFGVSFAAEVAVLRAGLDHGYHRWGPGDDRRVPIRSVRRRTDADLLNVQIHDPLSRLRSMLAALDTDAYRSAVGAVARLRSDVLAHNVVSSFLFPTEQAWVRADIADLAAGDGGGDVGVYVGVYVGQALLGSVTEPAQAEAIFDLDDDRAKSVWSIGHRMNLIHSMCANVGPGVEYLVAELFDGNLSAKNKKRAAALLTEFGTDAGIDLLLDRIDQRYAEPAFRTWMTTAADRARRRLGARTGDSTRIAGIVRDLGADGADQARAEVETPGLPAVLTEPPWLSRRARRAPLVLDLGVVATPAATAWQAGERNEWATFGDRYEFWRGGLTWEQVVEQVVAGRPWNVLEIVAVAPEHLARPLLATAPPERIWFADKHIRWILGRFDTAAADYVVRVVTARPLRTAHLLMPVTGTEVVGHMLRWLSAKSLRANAFRWFDRHMDAAAADVLAVVLATKGPQRARQERALRDLARRGHRAALRAAARKHGDRVVAELEAAIDVDPLAVLPPRIPDLPAWLDPTLLPPVLLRGTEIAIPPQALRHICTMLAVSRPDDVYAGVDIVRGAVEPSSLGEMTWGLFEQWAKVDFPVQQSWILDAQGITGTDDTVRKLAPLIRRWPLQSAHRRAAAGLDALASIGTDAALTQLHGIAEGVRFPALKQAANAHIERIADELGLTADELADRAVPSFGLDADGTTTLDYGERSFVVTFDEQLRTVVHLDGKPLTRLPRPGTRDSDSAATDYRRYLALRKDVRAVAGEQVARLERAMVLRRRWTTQHLRRHVVDHPLLWHLCMRLVWATYGADGTAFASFRFADDRAPISAAGDLVDLDGSAAVGIAHPLDIAESVPEWVDVFDDLSLVQPFEQMRRTAFALPDAATLAARLRAHEGKVVSTGSLLALRKLGWDREAPQDKGAQIAMDKRLDDAQVATIMVDPGFNAGDPMFAAEQKIVHVFVTGERPDHRFDPVAASELLRDLSTLTELREARGSLRGPRSTR